MHSQEHPAVKYLGPYDMLLTDVAEVRGLHFWRRPDGMLVVRRQTWWEQFTLFWWPKHVTWRLTAFRCRIRRWFLGLLEREIGCDEEIH